MAREAGQIMIVDDDPVTCELLGEVFVREGFSFRTAQSGDAALAALQESSADVLISDIRMQSKVDGLILLDQVRRAYPALPVILMTAFGSLDTAVRAVREGAFDYISKPFDIEAVVATVRRALIARLPHRGQATPAGAEEGFATGLVGRSPALLEIYKLIARVSDAAAAVLITGESGTGKELVARAIHAHGARHGAPFVAVNCGALTETLLESELFGHVKGSFTGAINHKRGIFEQAGAGTVFLDEISETSPALQVKLLRVLQEKEILPVGGSAVVKVRARVIAASNCELEKAVEQGRFRQDLLYRLNVITLHLPPLRERRDDIALLVDHFLRKHTPPGKALAHLTEQTLDILNAYAWPGNVRELENVIERAVTLSNSRHIALADLPERLQHPHLTAPPGRDELQTLFVGLPTIDEMERRYLLHVLEVTGGNRTQAAEILGINRRTLYRMAERFQIDL